MTEEIFDVVMQSTGAFFAEINEFQRSRPPEENLVLGPNLWIGHLPLGISSGLVFDACGPAGHNFNPTRQYGCRYSICRKVDPDPAEYYEWDAEGVIGRVLFISRLIRPTTIATNLSARLYFREGKLETIVPGRVTGYATHAWVVSESNWRDWLSVPECELLKEAIQNYSLTPPDRVRQARRHIDHAFHSFYLDQRCASLVTGFESLLKVSPYKATKQFALRAGKLASYLGLELTEAEAHAMYDDRSAFVHGTQVSFTEFGPEVILKYNRFEEVLRRCLFRASTDANFAALFSSDQNVEDTFGKL